jgi:alpha-glucoside transport system permease protein
MMFSLQSMQVGHRSSPRVTEKKGRPAQAAPSRLEWGQRDKGVQLSDQDLDQHDGPPGYEARPPLKDEGDQVKSTVLGIVAAVTLPIVLLAVFYGAFLVLRDSDINRIAIVAIALLVGVAGVFALYWVMNFSIDHLPERLRVRVRPWAFVGPALVFLSLYLVYPAINTVIISFQDKTSDAFVGFDNYVFVFTDEAMLRSIRNTLGWIIVVPAVSVSIGLAFAVLVDKLRRGEAVAKSLIFLPMAISFVAASIVWRFVYSFRPEGFGEQIGLLNSIWMGLGNDPVAWLLLEPWNNLFLMVIMIWLQTGFAMVILSAAIKGVPADILEASRIDGANEFQVFRKITVPSILSTIVVVMTTAIITVMKVFDIVWVMTNGEFGTEVIAERMIRWFFRFGNNGRGAAIAVVLFVAIIPVMVFNVKRFKAEEAIR